MTRHRQSCRQRRRALRSRRKGRRVTKAGFNSAGRQDYDHQKALVRLITGLSHRHGHWQVFADFVEMAAISLSNAIDLAQREARESRYLEAAARYTPEELQKFPQMLGELVMALEQEPADVLGATFHDLELHSKYAGQFFSPYSLCRMIAKMTVGSKDAIEGRLQARGFIRASEPAAGSGAMVIALAHEMRDAGINYQQHLHVTATDVDLKCVHMAYVQLSLLHIPAVVIHGNSLSLQEHGHWFTPAHIMGGWRWKLRRAAELGQSEQPREIHGVVTPPPGPETGAPESPALAGKPMQLTLF